MLTFLNNLVILFLSLPDIFKSYITLNINTLKNSINEHIITKLIDNPNAIKICL